MAVHTKLHPKLTSSSGRHSVKPSALGLSTTEAKEWRVQYALLKRLKEIVRKHKVTNAEIAGLSRTSRTRVTAILNGDLGHVSTDLLIRLLGSLGYQVKVSVVRSTRVA